RSGADPHKDDRVRCRGKRHARPADRANLARSRHRVFAGRHGPRLGQFDAGGNPAGGRHFMSQIDGLPPLREVIAEHGLRAKKELGQNFLLDLNLTGKIARAAGDLAEVTVIEVGPGPGGLTRALLAAGAKQVIAIERDERTLPALAQIAAAYPGRLEVISADALEIDYRALASGRTKIVANLPYNIATPLLTGWLSQEPWPAWFESLTLMFQREVA